MEERNSGNSDQESRNYQNKDWGRNQPTENDHNTIRQNGSNAEAFGAARGESNQGSEKNNDTRADHNTIQQNGSNADAFDTARRENPDSYTDDELESKLSDSNADDFEDESEDDDLDSSDSDFNGTEEAPSRRNDLDTGFNRNL